MDKSKISILLVEDDTFYADLLAGFLGENGYPDIRRSTSGVDCMVQAFEGRTPDIVIMDYKLGHLDGISIMEKLLLYKPDMKIIFISNQIDLQVAVNAMKFGAEDYLRKNDELFSNLSRTLNRISVPRKDKSPGRKLKKLLEQALAFCNDIFLSAPNTLSSNN